MLIVAQLQQKGLPKWLKEELEQREKKKERDTEYLLKKSLEGNANNQPKWMDELEDETDEQNQEESLALRKRKFTNLEVRFKINFLFLLIRVSIIIMLL